jgi:tRNA dimethylallyltransferase
VTETVLAVFGPTASGKTAVAQALAARIPAELVSADSMQVYRGLPILTNQAPARLVGIWTLDHEASVAEYQRLAHAALDEILEAGRTPIVVGGTGLYLRAALADLSLPPAPEPGERERWERLYDEEGPEQAHARLAELDPEAAAAVHPNDRRRVVRSLELSAQPRERDRLWTDDTRHPTLVFGLDIPKDELDRRIAERPRRGRARPSRPGFVHRRLRARALGHRRARRRRGCDRGSDGPHEALRRLPAQVDATDTRPC